MKRDTSPSGPPDRVGRGASAFPDQSLLRRAEFFTLHFSLFTLLSVPEIDCFLTNFKESQEIDPAGCPDSDGGLRKVAVFGSSFDGLC